MPVKVLTIQQPFASLIAAELKEYEFRTWKTAYRGEILIHAGKRTDREAMARFAKYGLEYPLGCILAKAVLTDCIRVDQSFRNMLHAKNAAVYAGILRDPDWSGYGFHLEHVQRLDPIYVSGKLGLWEYPINEKASV